MRTELVLSLIPALLALGGCGKKEAAAVAPAEPPPVTAAVLTIQPEPFTATVPLTGTLISNTRVDVKAETVGRVIRFDKEEGAAVAAGETVVWVDSENFKLAARQAETGVQVAEAVLERGRAAEQHTLSELERARNLVRSGGITDKDLKAAELAARDARAQVQLAAAQLEQARAVAEMAAKHLRDTHIKSPVAGVIQRKFVNQGAYVEAPTPVFTVVDNSRLELESLVASADLAPIRPGQKVVFSVNSFPGVSFEGAVIEINPALDAESRSAKVRVRVPNPGGRLKAGMFAEGEILTAQAAGAVVIPVDAVHREDRSAKDSYVFVLEDGKAVRRPVRIGREQGARLEIQTGLQPGDRIIAEQSIEIAEGVRVQARR